MLSDKAYEAIDESNTEKTFVSSSALLPASQVSVDIWTFREQSSPKFTIRF